MKNIKSCQYCQGTGDWRGLFGKSKSDYKSEKNKCYHCNGTGQTAYTSRCKYCMEPCEGYICPSCLEEYKDENLGYRITYIA